MNQTFRTKKTVTFREADPAGIMFFGNIFAFAHDAFEEFIRAAGYQYAEWFRQRDFLIPIRHTEGDFMIPFVPGDTYDVSVTVASFGQTSFKMKYAFTQDGRNFAIVTMVHAVLDGKTMQKTSIPFVMKSRLEPFLEPEA